MNELSLKPNQRRKTMDMKIMNWRNIKKNKEMKQDDLCNLFIGHWSSLNGNNQKWLNGENYVRK